MSNNWPKVKLGAVLEHRKEFVTIDDLKNYRRPRVQLHAQGIVLRDELLGALIKTKKQQTCRAGELLVAEIDAKVGGYGIVPELLDGCIVSSHYFLFVIDPERLDRSFLDYFIRTPTFGDQVAAQGSTNYAAIRPSHVLNYEIPLPPLTEQRRIVSQIEELEGKTEEARGLRKQATEEAGALLLASSLAIFSGVGVRGTIGEVCDVIDPNPSHRYPVYVPVGIPIVSSSDFIGDDNIDPSRAKKVPESFYETTLGHHGVGADDVIFSRKGKVGYARLHPQGIRLAMTHTLCVMKPNRVKLEPRYLLHFARSPIFLEELTGTMNPNVGVPTLGLQVIRGAGIPLPPLAEQRRIVARLDDLQEQTDALKTLQAETAVELDALMPSILDKAFRGEL